MNAYIEILRPANALMAVIAVLLIAVITKNYTLNILLGAISVFIATGAGNTINDYFDYHIDKINKPKRPIPSGRIQHKTAFYYSISLFIIATIIGFIIGIYPGIVVLLCSIIMYLYAYDLKQRSLIGNITVAILTGLTFVYGGIITNNLNLSLILGLFAFLMTLSREIIKDTEDIKGDLKENAHTFPIKYGAKNATNLAIIINIITCILSPLLYIDHIFTIIYLPIVLVADIIFIYSAILARQDQSEKSMHKVSKYMKIGMFIAFISFAIGSPVLNII